MKAAFFTPRTPSLKKKKKKKKRKGYFITVGYIGGTG